MELKVQEATPPDRPPPLSVLKPNDRQRQAIESARPNCVTVAGPGTGKSKVLLWRAQHLVANRGVTPSDIVLVSFTNASVRDLRRTLESEEFAGAKGIRIATFHSLALRSLLRMSSGPSYVFIADDWEEANLIDPFLKRALGLKRVTTATKRRRDYNARWCQATESPTEWLSQRERQEFQRAFLVAKNVFDFTTKGELTYRWWLRLSSERDGTRRDLAIDFRQILVDEYQDLNECEHQILEMLARHGCGVFAVGDPNQSIYETMRHAHPPLCLSFAQRFSESDSVALNETYRCSRAILDAAAALMANEPAAVEVPTISHREVEGTFGPVNYADETAEASGVVAVAARLARQDPPPRILVLVPAKQVGHIISAGLTARGIEHQSSLAPRKTDETDPSRVAKALARLLGNRNDSLAAASAIVLSGPKSHRVENLAALVKVCDSAGCSVAQLLDGTSNALPAQLRGALIKVRQRLEELRAMKPRTQAIAALEAESALENLGRYLLPPHMRRKLEEPVEPGSAADDGQPPPPEEVPPGITVTTYHNSKGLEADIVFLTAVEPDFFENDTRSPITEKRRLLFVGITRARDAAFASYVSRRHGTSHYIAPEAASHRRGPSAFLTEIREQLDIVPISGTQFVQSIARE